MSAQEGWRSVPSRLGRRFAQMSVSQLLGVTIGVLLAFAVVGVGLALLANGSLERERRLLLDQVGPALRSSLKLENALINEETGVRGYLLTGEPDFLAPYELGLSGENAAYGDLHAREQAIGPAVSADVESVHSRANAWRQQFVMPALQAVSPRRSHAVRESVRGKRLFDSVRAALARLQSALTQEDLHTRAALDSAASDLEFLLVFAAVLILGGVLGAWLVLRRTITSPLGRLGAQARRVASGEFDAPLAVVTGPHEISELGAEIETMRRRILDELQSVEAARAQIEAQARELTRSNAELEQFAYVASHDLQEPLRKVASFCQALQKRYEGQLDARADQYIEFAVDGAKRMQQLINDLLSFSRVGRSGRGRELVSLNEALSDAISSLSQSMKEAGAEIRAGQLPSVRGDRALLTSLLQNLVSNSLKFRGKQTPSVRVQARLVGQEWEVSVTDNGIGVDQEYADRIFLIFQRLHSRETYDGSGIGLALARKIVEYHGGRIWLDSSFSGGACFRFTMPLDKESKTR